MSGERWSRSAVASLPDGDLELVAEHGGLEIPLIEAAAHEQAKQAAEEPRGTRASAKSELPSARPDARFDPRHEPHRPCEGPWEVARVSLQLDGDTLRVVDTSTETVDGFSLGGTQFENGL